MERNNLSSNIKDGTVLLISKSFCGYCNKAKYSLSKLGVVYESIEVDKIESKINIANLNAINEMCGITTYPKIFIGKKCIGGNSDLSKLIRTNKIYKLLDAENIKYNK